ncbi:MAG TPA: ATP-binding protein [Saprospiraceae bacterium]|nr:ATP-binding protein [Saprospiraceae bacterium]HNO36420.1 ATP-binding protein [Saprospiraceae bacterium]
MNNNKKILIYLSVAVGAMLALLADYHITNKISRSNFKTEIKTRLDTRHKLAGEFVTLYNQHTTEEFIRQYYHRIENLSSNHIQSLVFQNDSLIFWTSPPEILIDSSILHSTHNRFIFRNENVYEILKQQLSDIKYAVSVIKILPYNDPQLLVSTDSIAPKDIRLETSDHSEKVFVQSKYVNHSKIHQYLRLSLFLICFISLLTLIKTVSSGLIKHIPEWAVSAFILTGVFGLRLLFSMIDVSSYFGDISIFSKTLNSAYLGSSVGDFLLNALLFLWVVIYWFNTFKAVSYEHLQHKARLILGTSIFFAIVLGIIMISGIIKSTILESDIYFDFENIFNLSIESLTLMLGLMIVFIALFLYSQRLMFTINLLELSSIQRIFCIFSSLLLLFVFLQVVPVVDINAKFFLFILMYLLLLDFYSDTRTTDFTWLMIWLIIFSGFSAALLYTYNQSKEEVQLQQYSKILANPRDKYLEEQCRLLNIESERTKLYDLHSSLESKLYISKFYNIRDSFDANNISIWYPTQVSRLKWGILHNNGNTVYEYFHEGSKNYIYLETKDFMDFGTFSGLEGMAGIQFKGLRNIEKYGYALYYQGHLTSQSPNFRNNDIQNTAAYYKNLINQRFQVLGGRAEDPTGRVLEINKTGGGLIKILSLFSYIFVLLAVTFLFFIALNTFVKFIPGIYTFENQSNISLRNRIQVAIVSMIVVSFVAIGIITIIYFNFSNKKNLSENLIRKVTDISNRLIDKNMKPDETDLVAFNEELESEIIIYDKKGYIAGSFPAKIETVQPELQYLVKHPMVMNTFSQQQIGGFFNRLNGSYLVHTVLAPDSTVNGYIVMPFSHTDLSTNNQIADFIGALINTYVFLLLIASALALAVGRSITKPLLVLGDKLNRFKLGKQNEPISWSKNDEIGFLVGEYNQMIVKLEHSAGLLARSEREEAWREMARQVAHEIKNPLTPMKLNVQYLLHSYHSDPESREQRIKNICDTLVQQIENLSAIAGTFGEFAQEPKINSEDLHLNTIVNGIYELFEKTGNEHLNFKKSILDEDIIVHADKSHLIRIINNLIKNAVQAIPSERIGRVEVLTRREGNKIIIAVKDNGHGIDDSKKEKIFMPNFTTKSSGSGLGLAICKKLIESMDGEIYFSTIPDKGSTFFVRLPIKE